MQNPEVWENNLTSQDIQLFIANIVQVGERHPGTMKVVIAIVTVGSNFGKKV